MNDVASSFLKLVGGNPDRKGTNSYVLCGSTITGFKDELSVREFQISGLCQECQDLAFEGEEDYEC